jgi:hypothetical protein
LLLGGFLVGARMPGTKRRTPPVVVREPRTAPLSEENRRQAIAALSVMIHGWWSGDRGRSVVADGLDQDGDATAGAVR